MSSSCRDTRSHARREAERPAPKLLAKIYSITNADALTKSAFSIIEEYHPSAYLLLQSREKWQKMHNFQRFGVFSLASALVMLEAGKEKAALWAAGLLVVALAREDEVQPCDFAVAAGQGLAYAIDKFVLLLFVTWRLDGGRTHRDSAIIFCGIKNRNIDISMFLFYRNCKKCHFWQFIDPFDLQL